MQKLHSFAFLSDYAGLVVSVHRRKLLLSSGLWKERQPLTWTKFPGMPQYTLPCVFIYFTKFPYESIKRFLGLSQTFVFNRYYITRAKLVSKITKYPHVVSVNCILFTSTSNLLP